MKKLFLSLCLIFLANLWVPSVPLTQPAIAVHFHDPYNLISHQAVVKEVSDLNRIYARNSLNITFRLASDDELFSHIGAQGDLNVGINPEMFYTTLGQTMLFPWEATDDTLPEDFIFLAPDAATDADVLAHETGHWLGLLHSTQLGNCMAPNGILAGCTFNPDQQAIVTYWHKRTRH